MHPAFSIIFFTTATGAGYGLLAMLGILTGIGGIGTDVRLGIVGLGLALALMIAGLLSSTAHLGRPERAWRAFSQWRTSSLSREGVASIFTFIPAGAFALGWFFLGTGNGWVDLAGLLAATGAMVTVATTGMIYASIKPVAQWHSCFTVPGYIAFSLMTGSVLFNALLQIFADPSPAITAAALAATLFGWAWKRRTWSYNDALAATTSINSATGLKGGTVRSIEWPHTEENYLLKEMGFRIARKHEARLRLIAQILAFLVPAALLIAVFIIPWPWAVAFSVIAALCQFGGMLIERWLFFAEASHTVVLYYGR